MSIGTSCSLVQGLTGGLGRYIRPPKRFCHIRAQEPPPDSTAVGLVFQVGGFGLSGTRVMSTNWTRVTDQILDARGVAHLLRDLSELISAATSHTLGSTRGGH